MAYTIDKEGNKTQSNTNICYLKGYKCIAEAGYYGGVILSNVLKNTNKKEKEILIKNFLIKNLNIL